MLTGIFSVLGIILSIVFYELKRSNTKKDDPIFQNKERHDQADKDIVKHDDIQATVNATADLDALDRLQHR